MNYSNEKKPLTCKLPRKHEAVEALLSLIWKKQKKDRPAWIVDQVKIY